MAPLIVKDKVIVGVGGGEFGIRGFIAAYDGKTGKEVWRFNTIPGPGEAGHETWHGDDWKTGGASVWVTGSYDPALEPCSIGASAIPVPTGIPISGPATICIPTVSSRSIPTPARLKWHFQFTPNDPYDYDSVQVPVLADIDWQGRPTKGDAVGEPQRLFLRARSHQRKVPAGPAVRRR